MYRRPSLIAVCYRQQKALPKAGLFSRATGAGRSGRLALDQLDLVAVRILDKSDDAATMFHRARRARNLHAGLTEFVAQAIDIRHTDGDMAVAAADRIRFFLAPVMRSE